MKVSDFGTQIPVCPPKFDETNRTFSFNVGVQTAKAVDDAVIAEIYKIAKEEGITHLVVLDRENIKEALLKASAKKVRYIAAWPGDLEVCPSCDATLSFTDKYCSKCGQKLEREN